MPQKAAKKLLALAFERPEENEESLGAIRNWMSLVAHKENAESGSYFTYHTHDLRRQAVKIAEMFNAEANKRELPTCDVLITAAGERMKRGKFHICTSAKGEKVIVAEEVSGYIEDDVGVHKTGDSWSATDIPTGTRITSPYRAFDSALEAMKAAKKTILEHEDFDAKRKIVMATIAYKEFQAAVKAQKDKNLKSKILKER